MNVILVISDTLRRDHLGCYGNSWISTPHIDRLAAESVTFDHYYVGSYATVPVRYEILTGRHVFTYSAGWVPLPPNEVVLAQVLGQAGVASMMVVDTPHILKDGFGYDRGFSAWRWLRGQETDRLRMAPLQVTLPCAPEKLRNPHTNTTQYLRNVATRRGEADYFAPQTFGAAMDWLEENYGRGRNGAPSPDAAPLPDRAEDPKRPFFLYVDTFDPHEPWDPPQHYVDLYDPGYRGEEVIYPAYAASGFMTDAEERHARALYAGEVTMVDRWLGKLLQRVDDLGLRETTAVLFVADHGFFHGEHGWWGKGRAPFYDVLNHIPFLARIPGVAGGRRSDAFVQPVDLMPTILDLAGVPAPDTCHGSSLLPLVRGTTPDNWRSDAVSSTCFGPAAQRRQPGSTTLVTPEWTYLYLGGVGVAELYDARNDPAQRHNLAPERPDVVQCLHGQLLAKLEALNTPSAHLEARRTVPQPAPQPGLWIGPQGKDPSAQLL
jgi:arylsulfatase A-like enzyme